MKYREHSRKTAVVVVEAIPFYKVLLKFKFTYKRNDTKSVLFKVHNSMALSIFRIVQASPLSILKHFHHPKRVFLPPLTLFFQLHQNPSPRQPLILDISYKQNQMKYSNFNLFLSSSINFSRFSHAILCICTSFLTAK